MTSTFYQHNRQRLLEKLDEGSMVFLYSGTAPLKSNDQYIHPFPVNRNFYYLTGIDAQNMWLVLTKTACGAVTEYLFLEQPNEELIKWNGKMLTREQAAQKSGLSSESILYMQDMDRVVASQLAASRQLSSIKTVYFSLDRLSMNAPATPSERYAASIREKFPALAVRNILPLLAELRSIKYLEEIDCIRQAGAVTIEALRHMLSTAKPGEYEYQWQSDFEHYVTRAGMQLAFPTIAASGENGVMLHYSDNNAPARAGDLILFDVGAEYRCYSSDVSRTFPVGGKFNDRQKELFGIVLQAMEVAKEKMRPGVAIREANQAVIDFYKKALRSAKLIREDSEVSKYYYHGVSHSLGLDTHDPTGFTVYEPGMVVTCEPGLYVSEEGIGIRLENDILITEGAPEDLIGNHLLNVDELEDLMER